jgi:quinol-cytochrome oxidoreductase complex cytochrome b subunit
MILLAEIPPFITTLQDVLREISGWMLIVVPALVILTFAVGGLMLAKAEDGMEAKQIKEKMFKAVIGIAVAGGAVWIGDWLAGFFIPKPPA